MKPYLLIPCVAALLVGCSQTPEYVRPAAPVAEAWPQGPAYAPTPAAQPGQPEVADLEWQAFFTDPALQDLIQQALDNNRDLRAAALRIEQARAAYRITEADQLPTLNAGTSATFERTPKAMTSSGKADVSRTYSANLGVSNFEIDLFGRLKAKEDAALEQFLATSEAHAASRLTLIAEVANAYLTLLGDRKLLSLTEETLTAREDSLRLIERSFQAGVSSELDVAQARTAVETARINRARYLRQVAQDKNALDLLAGKPLADPQLAGDLDTPRMITDLPVGLPSQMLLRRPDIQQAEHSLKSYNADIGAARAAFFPSIFLTGALGLISPTLAGLFQGSAATWSLAPQVSMPLFDGGRNQANLDSAMVARDIAVTEYEKAIQTAFREVADALAARGTLVDQVKAQAALVEASATSYRLAQARYERGIDSYLAVLDAQRSLYSAQQDLVLVEVSRQTNLITLFKVLGGGRGPSPAKPG